MGKKQIASRTAGDANSGKSRVMEWERSKFTKGDLRKVRQFRLLPAATEVKFSGDETMPRPDEGWRMAESIQNWRKKWFYIKDEKAKEQKFGLAPFDPTKSVKKLKSWDQPLTGAELEETEPLMARIHTLQIDEGKELSGLQIMTHFLRMRVQPIQQESTACGIIWDPRIRQDAIPSSCRVTPFDKKHPPPAGHVFLSSLPPIPEAGEIPKLPRTPGAKHPKLPQVKTVLSQMKMKHPTPPVRDEEETPKDPTDERTQEPLAFTTTPSKTLSPQKKVVDSERLERTEESPQAPPKKKLKEHDATKGIKISENPSMSSMDDPIAREMMDMAIRHIRFRDEAKSLEVALKRSQHRADELEAKLEAAGKALEEPSAKATAAEEKLAEEKSKMATLEADIRLRLDTLNASFIKKIGDSYEMLEDQRTNPLLGSLTMLEANSVQVRNVMVHAHRAFTRLFGHFFLKQKQPEDLLALADVFNAQEDSTLNYRRVAMKTSVEIAMAMVMSHNETIDWDKVSSSHALDRAGQPMSLVPFLKNVKKFSKKMIALVHPTSTPSATVTPTEVQ
ncbi:hypothetical protein ACQ4PT_005717 [Festuca glaucescens]